MDERWIAVAGSAGYEISDAGRVRSVARIDSLGRPVRERILRGHKVNAFGHLDARFWVNGKEGRKLIHRLVLEAFVGPCPEGKEGCHGDGDPTNNRLINLRWDTRKNNVADTIRHGRNIRGARCSALHRGERNANVKLCPNRVSDLRVARYTQREIANWFGVSLSAIQRLDSGTSWSHRQTQA